MFYHALKKLIEDYPKIGRLFPGADESQLIQIENRLNIKFDSSLTSFYRSIGGGHILDYRFNTIKSINKYSSLEEVNESFNDDYNDWVKENVFIIMGTSSADSICFIKKELFFDKQVIGHLSEDMAEYILPLASSFDCFLKSFCRQIRTTLESAQGDIYDIGQTGDDDIDSGMEIVWPDSHLDDFLENDPKLYELLKSGKLKEYYKLDEFTEIIEKALENYGKKHSS